MKKQYVALVTAAAMLSVTTTAFARLNSPNTVDSAAIINGEVKTVDIANGAVTDAKISGPISAAKIAVANVIVVAKSGGQFTSPSAALASIADAAENNKYLIKVMPGTYDMGTTPLQMKDWVDVEGSGMNNTKITGATYNTDFETCSVGTVIMADNMTLKNIGVVNTAVDAGNDNAIAGVIFKGPSASAEGVKVEVGSFTLYGQRNNGICASGNTAVANLNNVEVIVRSNRGDANALLMEEDGSAVLLNSKLDAATAEENGYTHVIDCVEGVDMTGSVTVMNSVVEGKSLSLGGNTGLWINDCKTSISDSIVRISGGDWNRGVEASNGDLVMVNTQVYSTGEGVEFGSTNGTTAKISNSIIQGGITNYSENQESLRLFNNCDENLNPIANQ